MIDIRGPLRTITAIEETAGFTLLTLDCSHVSRCNQIFHYKVGAESRCTFCIDQNDLPAYLRSGAAVSAGELPAASSQPAEPKEPAMKTFTIDADHNITIHASHKDAAALLAEQPIRSFGRIFTNAEQLAEILADFPLATQVEIYNSFTGVKPVKKFMDRPTAARRIWAECEKMTPPEPKAEAPAAPAAKPATEKKAKAPKAEGDAAQTNGPRASSKTAELIEALKIAGGMTLDDICARWGWQKHTTRALMSAGGAITKKFGITVISEKVGDARTYRIAV
jgi:hypothetical protein